MSRLIRRASILISFALLLALPAEAAAVLYLTPPGKSGADQYFETIPTSSGNAAPPGSISGSANTGSQSLSQLGKGGAGAAALNRLGTEGAAAAALAATTAPPPVPGASASHHGTPQSISAGTAPAASGSASSGLSRALTGSDDGGLGLLLPLLLGTSLIVAVGVALTRVGRHPRPPELGA